MSFILVGSALSIILVFLIVLGLKTLKIDFLIVLGADIILLFFKISEVAFFLMNLEKTSTMKFDFYLLAFISLLIELSLSSFVKLFIILLFYILVKYY